MHAMSTVDDRNYLMYVCVRVGLLLGGGRSAMFKCAGALAFGKRELSLIGHLMELPLTGQTMG